MSSSVDHGKMTTIIWDVYVTYMLQSMLFIIPNDGILMDRKIINSEADSTLFICLNLETSHLKLGKIQKNSSQNQILSSLKVTITWCAWCGSFPPTTKIKVSAILKLKSKYISRWDSLGYSWGWNRSSDMVRLYFKKVDLHDNKHTKTNKTCIVVARSLLGSWRKLVDKMMHLTHQNVDPIELFLAWNTWFHLRPWPLSTNLVGSCHREIFRVPRSLFLGGSAKLSMESIDLYFIVFHKSRFNISIVSIHQSAIRTSCKHSAKFQPFRPFPLRLLSFSAIQANLSNGRLVGSTDQNEACWL